MLQLRNERWLLPAVTAIELGAIARLVRIHVLVHEGAEAPEIVLSSGAGFKIHGTTPQGCHRPRWRAASYSSMPAATETLRLSTVPSCGRRTRKSQFCRVRCRRPVPSAPRTSTTGPLRSQASACISAAASAPTDQRPASFSSLSERTRLVTATTGVDSAAPAATLRAL